MSVSKDELYVDELTKQKSKRSKSFHEGLLAIVVVMGNTDAIVAVKSLEVSSSPVNFHNNLASANNDEELLDLLQKTTNSKKLVSSNPKPHQMLRIASMMDWIALQLRKIEIELSETAQLGSVL